MNCRDFRRKHDAFVDDTLSGVDLSAMARHRGLCPGCARLDTRVRRALLVAHNLPTIEPSPAFHARLQVRLAEERALRLAGGAAFGTTLGTTGSGWWRPASRTAYTVIAAGILAVAGMAATWTAAGNRDTPIRLTPVVATLPEPDAATLATPAMVASMPAGMALWPAVFVAQQAPWHFAGDALAEDDR
jgi:hypothetical protein